jgi:hypothetical protein
MSTLNQRQQASPIERNPRVVIRAGCEREKFVAAEDERSGISC